MTYNCGIPKRYQVLDGLNILNKGGLIEIKLSILSGPGFKFLSTLGHS
jgi:hypothetical protein